MKTAKINVKDILYVLLMLPYVRIESVVRFPGVDMLYDVLKLVSFLLIFLMYFRNAIKRKLKVDSFLITILLLTGLTLVSALLHGTNVTFALVHYLPFVSIPLLISYVVQNNDAVPFFRGMSLYSRLLLLAHFVFLIIYPGGIYISERARVGMLNDEGIAVHLLGKANAVTPIIISMLLIIVIDDCICHYRFTKRTYIYVGIGAACIILMQSGTGIIGMGVIMILVLLYYYRTKSDGRRINLEVLLFISILLSIGVVFLGIQSYFSFLITSILGKEVTLSNRTNVWRMMTLYIQNHMGFSDYLIGTGLAEYKQEMFAGRYAHCHNQFFDQFIQSGIIGLGLYIRLYFLSLRQLKMQYDKKQIPFLMITGTAIISFTVMFVAEVFSTPTIIMVLAIAYWNRPLFEAAFRKEYLPIQRARKERSMYSTN